MLLDLRVAARQLRARPLFTLVAVATLAVGMGASAAIFSVINGVLLRPLPYPDSERLVSIYTRYLPSTGYDYPFFALSAPEFADLQAQTRSFSAVAAYAFTFRNLAPARGEVERVLTLEVTPGFFEAVGVPPARGRSFTARDVQDRRSCVAIVAAGLSGPTVRLDDTVCDVVGVMPDGFTFIDERVRVWTALAIDAADTPENRGSHGLAALARLRGGTTRAQAEGELQALGAAWSARYPDHYAKGHFAVTRPLHEDLTGSRRQPLLLLSGAVALVLVIVCINLGALLVSRGEHRRREFAVRRALGADRRRLIRQLLGETLLLTAIGGGAGLLLANWMLDALLALYPGRLPAAGAVAIDGSTLLFAIALVGAAGLTAGLAPALHATGVHLQESLKADGRAATAGRRGVTARSALVVCQIALSLVLLVGTVLLIRTYQHLQRVDLGFDPSGVLTFTVSVPEARQPDAAAARRLLIAIESRLAALPGVEAAGAVSSLPLVSPGPPDDFVIEGRPAPGPGAPAWNARYVMATPRAFATLGIPLRRGRLLEEGDGPGRPLVAVINESAARLYWPGEDPVDHQIRHFPRETSPTLRIVGVVGDVRSLGPRDPAPPAIYVPFAQAPRASYAGRTMTFVVRSLGDPDGGPEALAAPARAAVAAVVPGVPLAGVRTLPAIARAATGEPRFTTIVMAFFAAVASFLAALGLYGVMAYGVEQRVREIGLRIALGAGPGVVLRLVVGSGLALAAAGVAVGVPAALAMTAWMRGLLSGVTSTDPLTYAAVIAIFAGTALLASYLPARRAMRIDPAAAVRAE